MIKALVEYITKNIVDSPEQVSVTEKDDKNVIYLEIAAPSKDIGKIVGKNGQTVKSLRTILNATATKMKKKVVLDVKEIKDKTQEDATIITK